MAAGKTVLITGSSIGIGRATAELFQKNGWQVAATMRNPDAGAELAGLRNVLVTKLDVTDFASIDAVVNAVVEHFGGIDVLVNNAGYGVYGVLEATSVESMRRQFETNVIGLLAMTKAVVPGFRRQGSGVIVNVSSISGRLTLPFSSPYSGTKFAVEGISEALRYEMREIGVRVKLVEPGMIKTNFSNVMEFNNDSSLGEYQRLVGKLREVATALRANGAESLTAAEAIYTAATDATDQLRYTVGEDAKQLAAQRAAQDDATFFEEMGARFGQ
jgi:NAD(P)-dependent dehydrogenase (short-subunit alcohol dehydrogenase family)